MQVSHQSMPLLPLEDAHSQSFRKKIEELADVLIEHGSSHSNQELILKVNAVRKKLFTFDGIDTLQNAIHETVTCAVDLRHQYLKENRNRFFERKVIPVIEIQTKDIFNKLLPFFCHVKHIKKVEILFVSPEMMLALNTLKGSLESQCECCNIS